MIHTSLLFRLLLARLWCSSIVSLVLPRFSGRGYQGVGGAGESDLRSGGLKMGTTKLVYQVSSSLVVLLFGFAGLVKVVPGLSPAIHQEMVGR